MQDPAPPALEDPAAEPLGSAVDTIAAFSSAVAPAARIVLRTSGPRALPVAAELCGALPASAAEVTLAFAGLRCPAWVYVFRAPRSYTGEDTVEYHLPGSPVLARMLLDELLARGMRSAEPGEFTARAYFAGKLDLTGAEGVAATIAAGNAAELAAARQLMAGELARRLRPVTDGIADTLALVEIGIDFAEEDVTFLDVAEVRRRVAEAEAALAALVAESDRFEPLSHEPRVVLAGRPNAGKSSLLNALAGVGRAIVSPVAGTTRDVLTAAVDLPRGRVQLVDAAGLDPFSGRPEGALFDARQSAPSGRPLNGEVDDQMQSRAAVAIAAADVLVLVRDATDDRPDVPLSRPPDLRVVNKVDLTGGPGVSAITGHGLGELRLALDAAAFGRGGTGGRLALNRRHLSAVAEARAALARAAENAPAAELAAADLRSALDAVGSVVGTVTPDDVLGRIFGAFCIGK
jgi:tRNA modification GTPase